MKRLALLALISAVHLASSAHAASLCRSGETTYFHCSIQGGTKLVSLCGKDLDGRGSYLQYRSGAPGRPADMIYPPAKNDVAMGDTFYYDSAREKDDARVESGVWFEHGNTYYELKHVVYRGGSGAVTGSESEILMWAGIPAGAPRPIVCKESKGGQNLFKAGPLIGAMAPKGRTWQMSPLDLHYKLRPRKADKVEKADKLEKADKAEQTDKAETDDVQQ
jgi:hypothetical protein